MFINRLLFAEIKTKLISSDKIVIIYGARQVGKTTLANAVIKNLNFKTLVINADEKRYVDILSSRNINKLRILTKGYQLLFIDEAQRVPEIGINLKMLNDNFPNLKILASGSSSLELADKIKEPLTGRTWTYTLYPVSFEELLKTNNAFELDDRLEEFLVYGSYPEIFSLANIKDKKHYLQEICSAYLYKDILELSSIKHSHKIHALLRLLAFQIGSQVSISELATQLGMSKDTVNVYIDLLEKSFVVFRLSGFNKNLRKEVTKMDKIYFYDLGIRNTIIENLNTFEVRNDIGSLWENYLIIERKKHLDYNFLYTNSFYWRTYTGAELDYVEENGDKISGYEFKFSPHKKAKVPQSWQKAYPDAAYQLINRDNYFDFIS